MTARTQRGFSSGVGDQVFTHQNEAERPRSEVGAFVALIRKWNHRANSAEDLLSDTTSRERAILRDVFPNLGYVLRRKRMKPKALLRGH